MGKKYNFGDVAKILFKCASITTATYTFQKILSSIVPTFLVVVMADFINTVLKITQEKLPLHNIHSVVALFILLIAYQWISYELMHIQEERMLIKTRCFFGDLVMTKRARLKYRFVEDNEAWSLVSRIADNPEKNIVSCYNSFLQMGVFIIRIAGIIYLIMIYAWVAAILILLLSCPLFILAIKSGQANYEAQRETTESKRGADYLSEVLVGRDSVNERTLFGFSPMLNKEWSEKFETARTIQLKTSLKWFVKTKMGSIFTACISIITTLFLLPATLLGKITVGLFVALVGAVYSMAQMMSWEFTDSVDQLAKYREYLRDLSAFFTLDEIPGILDIPAAEIPVFETVEFKDVKFKYPGTDTYILNGVSFVLESNKHYSFVGVNGAGKTTIIKLLTGLYDNYEGQILLNGKDIRQFSPSRLKAVFSVVNQDYAKYSISVSKNITIGALNLPDEIVNERLESIIDDVGLKSSINSLPDKLDTRLGKDLDGGNDLSEGQWQRVAIARSLISLAPICILDEPTAALDPIGESNFYESLKLVNVKKTTILISHRLASTKFSDYIFVIDNGKSVEEGTQEELLKKRELFSKMYDMQRSWYL